jgi:ubiquinol-cytochrome c reductase cytochrome b subunit
LLVGGSEYGHFTLTRFFALHAGVLPFLLIVFLAAHLALFRRHGITAKQPLLGADDTFWPNQLFRDAIACLAVLLTVLGLTCFLGAELGAPADPVEPFAAARPEWYFLFLFQFLKLFPGTLENIGAIYVPAAVILILILMPILGRWRIGHGFNVAFLCGLILGAGVLTAWAVYEDRHDVETYLPGVEDARDAADRARDLASGLGIPPEGALKLMREDAYRQGKRLFSQHCAACHSHSHENAAHNIVAREPSAPNLFGIGTVEWIQGLLDPKKIAGPDYFGNSDVHKDGEMVDFVTNVLGDLDQEEIAGVPWALAVEAGTQTLTNENRAKVDAGRRLLANSSEGCATCHPFGESREMAGSYPDLTGYASRDWLMGMISNPEAEPYYASNNDRMPAFHTESPILTEQEIGFIVDWLRGEWFRPAE